MKIISIKYLETLKPNMGSGTGYSEPDKFHIVCDENLYANDMWHADSCEKDIYIDTWYVTRDRIRDVFVKTITNKIGYINNFDEAFEMYINELKKK